MKTRAIAITVAIALFAGLTPAVAAAGERDRDSQRSARCKTVSPKKGTKSSQIKSKTPKPRRCARSTPNPKTKPKPKPDTNRDARPRPDDGDATPPNGPTARTPLPSEPPSPPAPGGGSPSPPPALNAVGVRALDRDGTFVFETSRSTVGAGTLTVSFRNDDSDDHNLWIEGTAPLIDPFMVVGALVFRESSTVEINVNIGTYRFYCSIPGHGTMTKQLNVT